MYQESLYSFQYGFIKDGSTSSYLLWILNGDGGIFLHYRHILEVGCSSPQKDTPAWTIMERVLSTKYKIIFLNHESTKWIIPPNKGFYVPCVLLQYIQQQCPQDLEATLRRTKVFSQEKHQSQRHRRFGDVAYYDDDDLESLSSVSSSVVGGTQHSEMTEEFLMFTIHLSYPPSIFEAFCIWIQAGFDLTNESNGNNYIPRFVYPTLLEWYGVGPLDKYIDPSYDEGALINQINSLVGFIQRNIDVLNRLKPDPSSRKLNYGDWYRLKNELRIGTALPHVASYHEVFLEDIQGVLKKNPGYSGVLIFNDNSQLLNIPKFQCPHSLSIGVLQFHTFEHVSKQFMHFYNQLCQVKILLIPHTSCPSKAKEKLPTSIQLVLDTLILSKQISLEKAFEYSIESFDADDIFWNNIEDHIGKKLWDELRNFHEQSPRKKQRKNPKDKDKEAEEENILKDFLDAFSKEFDTPTREKLLLRFEWAKKVTSYSTKYE